jgi:type VI secretion system protein VasG
MDIDIRTLLGKLNPECKRAMTQAAELCVRQTHFHVDVEHLLSSLLDPIAPDLAQILPTHELTVEAVQVQLQRSLEQLKRGNSRTPALSPHFAPWFQEAWLISAMLLGEQQIRSGTLLLAMLELDGLRGLLIDIAPSLLEIPRATLRGQLQAVLMPSAEDAGETALRVSSPLKSSSSQSSATPVVGEMPSLARASSSSLNQFTVDLTRLARDGKIDPVRGRDIEIRQVIDVLLRRRQNNPILTGEAGVGKTAVVEGFAQRIVAGDVPQALRQVSVLTLDLALLQAGAGVKGEFENRLKSVIAEVKASPTPIILFIDEAHQLIGAGGTEGQGDAANLLKPALARGELRTIAATTWAEYKRYVERDPALARRFQVIKVEEPEPEAAIDMLRGMVATLQQHHGVEIVDEAVREAVLLSHRYISGRKLPDKAISVLDTACARVAIAQDGRPAGLENLQQSIDSAQGQLAVLRREQATGTDHQSALIQEQVAMVALVQRREHMQAKLDQERQAVTEIVALRRHLQGLPESSQDSVQASLPSCDEEDNTSDPAVRLQRLMTGLKALQDDDPQIPICVDAAEVAEVISGWTGIPVRKMLVDELHTILHLKDKLAERVVGQDSALDAIARRVRTFRAELDDPGKPVGVFMLVGPSGVGKTETACALADLLYGGERNMVVVNMSEFQEAHSVSSLKGAPPGYVGYGRGGVLTEAVRRRPYSVVLLDEMEKAHPDVLELFFQVFDKGVMEDGEGVQVDFRNTLILLTSNAAQDVITDACANASGYRPTPDMLTERLRPALLRQFSPAFLGRLVVVPYYPLGDAQIHRIVGLKLARLKHRFATNHHARFTWDKAVVEHITARCTEVDSGARNVDDILTHSVLPEVSTLVLEHLSMDKTFSTIHMYVGTDGHFSFDIDTDIQQAGGIT